MTWLLDVNVLVACGWESHVQHAAARRWVESVPRFSTCPLTQLGFLRVSMSPAFRATWADAGTVLADMLSLRSAHFVADDEDASRLPAGGTAQDVTDSYLVALARAHRLKLATLDDALCAKPWARGIAVNPIAKAKG